MEHILTQELAGCLRSWRERIDPEDVGLPAGGQRRVAGLRREEVAQLAGVSMDYLVRLEQGRATHPSASVLAALARALRLNDQERDHLYRLAEQPPPGSGVIDGHISPSLARLIDRLGDVAVVVSTVAGEVIATNPLAGALFLEPAGASRRERTLAWREFHAMATYRIYADPSERIDHREALVADLQRARAAYPEDSYLADLVSDLRRHSPEFETLWANHHLHDRHAREKRFEHPQVGLLTLNCDDLAVSGTALKVAVFSAEPGSPSAQALALLGAIGLQRFDAAV